MNAWQQLSVNALLGTQKNTTPIDVAIGRA
jgi:hypothetical protein